MSDQALPLNVLIFGGGAAGLWLLDDLHRAGYSALLIENKALGSGQTVASQGIIHGGLKYTLAGKVTNSAMVIKELPRRWRQCLAGESFPSLSQTPMRSQHCVLWSTQSLRSKLGMFGASHALAVKPQAVTQEEWPLALQGIKGSVQSLSEQVIDPQGFIAALASQHRDRLMLVDDDAAVEFKTTAKGVDAVAITNKRFGRDVTLQPTNVVLAAGVGNAGLRERLGLPNNAMQRRPVHMILARGDLPELNGHCIDGRRTRVTITTDHDTAGRTIWQIGGQVSEDGVSMTQAELITYAQRELRAVLPCVSFDYLEWTTYLINKAEGVQKGGKRPATETVLHEGNVITVWPTKLVLAPIAAQRVMNLLPPPNKGQHLPFETAKQAMDDWPRPSVAEPPWETIDKWISDH